jgi:branched-chain amino acid transport system substrate-binding protein
VHPLRSGAFATSDASRPAKATMARIFLALGIAFTTYLPRTQAQKQYSPGATDAEIDIGNIATHSGWARAYGAVADAEAAYFRMINDRGGVNGRRINFISLDAGSDPAKAAGLARQLVEVNHVLLIFSPIGTETNIAMRPYLNEARVPQLFVESSSATFDDPSHFRWTMGFYASYRTEGKAYAKYLLKNRPNARIGVLFAANDAGGEYLAGVHEGLGQRASTSIVREMSYQTSDDTLRPQIIELKGSGADVFLNLSVGAFTTKAIREAYDAGWRPLQFIPNASLSISAFLDPAGLKKAVGIISNARSKGWTAPGARSDPEVRDFLDWMERYNPGASLRDQNNVAGYERAEAMIEVLKKCGDILTRENVMRQAANLDLRLGMLRPGIGLRTGPDDYQPIKQLFLVRFDGANWTPLGPVESD